MDRIDRCPTRLVRLDEREAGVAPQRHFDRVDATGCFLHRASMAGFDLNRWIVEPVRRRVDDLHGRQRTDEEVIWTRD